MRRFSLPSFTKINNQSSNKDNHKTHPESKQENLHHPPKSSRIRLEKATTSERQTGMASKNEAGSEG